MKILFAVARDISCASSSTLFLSGPKLSWAVFAFAI